MPVQFGRKTPRSHDPSIPHLHSIKGARPTPPSAHVDYTTRLHFPLGEMLNETLNDCLPAAYYHAREVWTSVATGNKVTEPDSCVRALYEEACGYDPKVKGLGPGGDAQQFLKYLQHKGAPVLPEGSRDHLLGFFELDAKDPVHVKCAIEDCGAVLAGLVLPAQVVATHPMPALWTYKAGEPLSQEGHALLLVGYDTAGVIAISWGRRYTLTFELVHLLVEEAYALCDSAWLDFHGKKTVMGLSRGALEAELRAIAVPAAPRG